MKILVRSAFAVMILAGTFPAPVVADGPELPPLCFPTPCSQQPSPGPKAPGAHIPTLR